MVCPSCGTNEAVFDFISSQYSRLREDAKVAVNIFFEQETEARQPISIGTVAVEPIPDGAFLLSYNGNPLVADKSGVVSLECSPEYRGYALIAAIELRRSFCCTLEKRSSRTKLFVAQSTKQIP